MAEYTREDLIEAAKKAAAEVGEGLTRSVFTRLTGINQRYIYLHFPEGGFSELRELAGLNRHHEGMRPLSDEELLEEFHRVTSELERIPTWALFADRASFSNDVIRRRFGGMEGTLKRYRDWLEKTEPDSNILALLPSKHEIPVPPSLDISEDSQKSSHQWVKVQGPQFGAPMNFRGLRHAPINEQGVVFLFGMVSYELGFIVEAVHAAFPDCEAKRCVDSKTQRWQRVRIEFEFRSSNFVQHGHACEGCDVIICWEHDWKECPLEVVELKKLIQTLEP